MPVIEVSTDHLKAKSNVQVECWCERCEAFFTKRFNQYSQYCNDCNKIEQNKLHIGNKYGSVNKGRKNPKMAGHLNPRWNPNKSEFRAYAYKVSKLTKRIYEEHKEAINPDDYPRTLCGVEGGYQLDHIVSIKYGFDNKINPEELAKVENLRMLTWQENNFKRHKAV